MKKNGTVDLREKNRRTFEDEISEKQTAVHYYPLRLQIEHSNICNAQCIMCSHYFTRNSHPKYVDFSLLERLKTILPYVEKITLHGVGEPLAHPRIAEFIEFYHDQGIRVGCNTNLSFMDKRLAEAIHEAFSSIVISCDGAEKETYEGIRKGLSFERFLNNARILRQTGEHLKMRMHTVAMRQNLEELPKIVQLAASLGCSHVTIVDLTTQEFLGNEKDAIRHYPKAAGHYLSLAREMAEREGISIVLPEGYVQTRVSGETMGAEKKLMKSSPFFPGREHQDALQKKFAELSLHTMNIRAEETDFLRPGNYHCNGICDYFAAEPYIDVNGNVFMCCVNWLHCLGNIYEQSFEEIWNNGLFRGIRKIFYDGRIPIYCQGCLFLRTGMFAPNIRVTDMDKEFYNSVLDETVARTIRERLDEYHHVGR